MQIHARTAHAAPHTTAAPREKAQANGLVRQLEEGTFRGASIDKHRDRFESRLAPPTTEAPTTEAPTTEAPGTEIPATEIPATGEFSAETPTATAAITGLGDVLDLLS